MTLDDFRLKLSEALEKSKKYEWVFYGVFFFLMISFQVTLFNPHLIPDEVVKNYLLPLITAFTLIPLTSFAYGKLLNKKENDDIYMRCLLCKSPMEPIGKWVCMKDGCNGTFLNEK